MNESKQSLEEFLFAEAVRRAPAERGAFLDGVCRNNTALRERLALLLEGHGQAEGFLTRVPPHPTGPAGTIRCESPSTEATGDRIDRYKLLEKLGEGGCGVVYMAEQKEPIKRRVALKVIKLGMDTRQVVARFEAERQALALMDHPSIAKVLDAGATETGRPYFVMELVRGIPITKYCEEARLNTAERLGLVIKVCQAIQHAHQKGIVHRDIKPSNILVTLHDGVPVPKVIDFGIAKATQQELTEKTIFTQFHQFIGTPAYMSPEQAEMSGLDIDTRTDIYSLGVLLYEILTGSTPFDTKELVESGLDEMRRIICEREPMRPSTRLRKRCVAQAELASPGRMASLPMDLDWIVMKCLEKDRSRRYETANGLALDLKRHLDDEPVLARPPSASYRIQKAFWRHKIAFAAGAAVAGALAVGISVSVRQAVKASRAQRAAETARSAEREQRLAAQRERDNATAAQNRAEQERAAAQRNLYVADLNLIQQAWDQNDVARIRQLLEDSLSFSERGFEWFYWNAQIHQESMRLEGHVGSVLAVAFSGDNRWIATGSDDWTAKVWETASARDALTLRGHAGPINGVGFSRDGRRLVTASGDQTARVWDLSTGTEMLVLKGHTAHVRFSSFSPDDQWILTGGADRTARLWDAASGIETLALKGHTALVTAACFSGDGQRIVTGSADGTVKVWEPVSGRELFTIRGNRGPVNSVNFSSDGTRIVTGNMDGSALVWDSASGRELAILEKHGGAVNSVAFSPDGQRVVTGCADQIAKIWDAESGRELRIYKGHGAEITSVVFSSDGRRILTGSADHIAKVWQADRPSALLSLEGHSGGLFSAAFSRDGQRIVTASEDGTAKVWEALSGRELLTLRGHRAWILRAAFSPDGQEIVTGSDDQTTKLWEAGTGAERLTIRAHASGILSVAFSPDGRRVATSSSDQTAKVCDAFSGKELLTLKGHRSWVPGVAFSPDGRRIATGSADQTAKVWDAESGDELATLSGHSDWIGTVAFSADGSKIATGSGDHTAKIWDAVGGKELVTLTGHNGVVNSVAFSPDGRRIVTGSYDRTAKIWEVASGKELLTLRGHSDWIHSAVFSPDGRRIVTASVDRTAKVWESASAEQVENWRREEKAAREAVELKKRERQAAAQRERELLAQGAGAIKQWLVLLPIPFERHDGAVALMDEQLPQEAQLQPRGGEKLLCGGTELLWKTVALEGHSIDFSELAGAPVPWSVAYAVSYLRSDSRQSNLLWKVASDDRSKMYLNGELVYQSAASRSSLEEADIAAGLELRAGINVVVLKVVNETGGWQGSVRITDREGHSVQGLEATAAPGAAEVHRTAPGKQ